LNAFTGRTAAGHEVQDAGRGRRDDRGRQPGQALDHRVKKKQQREDGNREARKGQGGDRGGQRRQHEQRLTDVVGGIGYRPATQDLDQDHRP
jgi:hypothetical protein